MSIISVRHLNYRYPLKKELTLVDLSFAINKGEFIGIVGQNLAGKSTLCQALIGLVPHFHKGAYGGIVEINGINVQESDVNTISEKAGIVFQNPFTQISGSKLTVYEEIAFGLENLGIPQKEMKMRIDQALKLLDIYECRNQNPFELSGGQMQRMAIASIITMRPEVIILDEPTSQLDPQGTEEVFRAINALSKEGMTVIMVEHKIESIAKYADRIMLMANGGIIDFNSPQKVFSRADILDYGVPPPVYTQICRQLGIRNKNTGLYPITLEEAYEWMVSTE